MARAANGPDFGLAAEVDQGKASRHFAQPPLSRLAKKTSKEKGRKCAARTLNMHSILILIESQDKMHTRS